MTAAAVSDSDIAISVEGLAKSYLIGHDTHARSRDSFRDTMARSVRGLGRTALAVARGRQLVHGDSVEEFWALDGVSFEVKRGEVLGIIGRNGAGKSTLLKILSRITEPTRGRAVIRGRVASLLEVGTGFHGDLTGRENIYLNGAILGMTRTEIAAKFDEIVAFAEVEKFLDTPVKRYSSGMYVRLAFAVAAHLEPEILIVDEVLAVGDAEFQKKCLGKMKSVSRNSGRTVIFVSHNMQAVATLCDTALMLANGKFVSRGPSRDVVAEYLSAILDRHNAGGQMRWDDVVSAPGNDDVRIHQVRVVSSDGDQIQLSSEVRIEFTYWNMSSENTMLNLMLYNSEGLEVFEDWSSDDPEWIGRRLPNGLIKTSCIIPASLLNAGTYRVRMVFFGGNAVRIIYDFDDAVMFEVVDTAPKSVQWFGRFIGPVHPKLGWKTEVVEHAAVAHTQVLGHSHG